MIKIIIEITIIIVVTDETNMRFEKFFKLEQDMCEIFYLFIVIRCVCFETSKETATYLCAGCKKLQTKATFGKIENKARQQQTLPYYKLETPKWHAN